MKTTLACVAIVLASLSPNLQAADEGKKALSPLDFTLESVDGTSHKFASAKGSVTVFEWARPDCPCTLDYYKGALPGLQSEMQSRSVKWFVILPVKKDATSEERKKLVNLLEAAGSKPGKFLFDPGFAMTDALEIEILPHVIILNELGETAYAGALDTECKPTTGDGVLKTKSELLPQSEKRDYLRESLNNLLSGVPITDAKTEAKGCPMIRFKVDPVPQSDEK